MDQEAEQEISSVLGVRPWRLDSYESVPIHRPRFCWTNQRLFDFEGMWYEEKERWYEIHLPHDYPLTSQWIEEGAEWPGYEQGAVLLTAMKAIPRKQPPPFPAGLARTDQDTQVRWQADSFRYPPYQYGSKFIFWVNGKWRLASASERELLHGLGFGHMGPCWNANQIKQDAQGYEDCRKSLVGDSFNCYSFAFVAALLVSPWQEVPNYSRLWNRMGMAPGFCAPIGVPFGVS